MESLSLCVSLQNLLQRPCLQPIPRRFKWSKLVAASEQVEDAKQAEEKPKPKPAKVQSAELVDVKTG